jgi:hypothetical protein
MGCKWHTAYYTVALAVGNVSRKNIFQRKKVAILASLSSKNKSTDLKCLLLRSYRETRL